MEAASFLERYKAKLARMPLHPETNISPLPFLELACSISLLAALGSLALDLGGSLAAASSPAVYSKVKKPLVQHNMTVTPVVWSYSTQ